MRCTMASISPVMIEAPVVHGASPFSTRCKYKREGLRLGVAHGDQPVAGEDEGDGRRLRDRRLDVVDDRRRHEVGAALLVEPIGRLDLAHLGA